MADLNLLRLFVNDPKGANQFFTSSQLEELLADNEDDVYAAAADGWRIKAGRVSEWYQVSLDGSTLSRDQVFDHCLEMAKHYEATGGGQLSNTELVVTPRDDVDAEFGS